MSKRSEGPRASEKPRSEGPDTDASPAAPTDPLLMPRTLLQSSSSLSAAVPSAAADRFLALWRQGQRPDLDQFFAQEEGLALNDMAAVLRVDQAERRDRGEFVTAETYLERYPNFEQDPEAAVDLIYGEFLLREEYGERPEAAEYLRRFPEHAEVLGSQIELHLAMEAAGGEDTSGMPSAGDWSLSGSPRVVTGNPGVLEALSDTLGPIPQIHLIDSEGESTTRTPASSEVVGRLELLNEVARGGMGIILRGRDRDLGRELAVKILRDSHRRNPDIVRRFIEEAQIGGQLQHPGIVPVYELGVLSDRRPFFSMQLVRGRTLAEILAERPAPMEDLPRLLDIFERVAQTVAYAHSRGVIHRDLKPANIMVGRFGEVQVMDWGLAKVLGAKDEGGGETRVRIGPAAESGSVGSRADSVMGTPAYMAPEQARGEVARMDARVDVFALGALLCEILTGTSPYPGGTASEVLRQAARGDTSAACERISALPLDPELKALALRCLAADPGDRPADADAVATVVIDHLAGVQRRLRETELARVEADTRAQEQEKRRRSEWRLAAGLLLALLAGGAGVVTQWRRAERNLVTARDANQQLAAAVTREGDARAQAEARLGLAMAAIERYYTGVGEELHLREPGLETLRARLLGAALEFYKKLQDQLESQPDADSRPELAEAYEKVADVIGKSGDSAAVEEPLRRALAIRERVAADQPEDPSASAAAALVQIRLGSVQDTLGRPNEALKHLESAQERLVRLSAAHPGTPAFQASRAETLTSLGVALEHLGRLGEATHAYEQAGDLFERLVRDFPDEPKHREGQARALHNLGVRLSAQGRSEEAIATLKRSANAFEEVSRTRPENTSDRAFLGLAWLGYGIELMEAQRLDEARKAIQRAESIFEPLVQEYPNNSRFRGHLAGARVALGTNLARGARWDAAIVAFRRAAPVLEHVVREQPEVSEFRFDLAQCRLNIGIALRRSGHPEQALSEVRESLAILEPLAQQHPGVEVYRREAADAHINLGALHASLGEILDAQRAYLAAAADYEGLAEPSLGDLYNIACARARLATLDPENSLSHINRAMALLKRVTAVGYPDLGTLRLDPDLEPLRTRPDFAALLLDRMMPANPFAH